MTYHFTIFLLICFFVRLRTISVSRLHGFVNYSVELEQGSAANTFNASIWPAEAEGETGGVLDFEVKPGLQNE